MPNTREKLIDLRQEAEKIAYDFCASQEACDKCPYNAPRGCQEGMIADHLIANGVTVQKWIPVTERLPEPMVDVLCWYEHFRYGSYNRIYQTYGFGHYFGDGFWGGEVSNVHKSKVLAWMPLPEPPKGE